jgi:hypothetical protein
MINSTFDINQEITVSHPRFDKPPPQLPCKLQMPCVPLATKIHGFGGMAEDA